MLKDESVRQVAVASPPHAPLTEIAPPPAAPATSVDAIIRDRARKVLDHTEQYNLKDIVELFRKQFIEESLRRTRGNVKEAEGGYWGYAETGKGGLMHQIKKFGIDPGKSRLRAGQQKHFCTLSYHLFYADNIY